MSQRGSLHLVKIYVTDWFDLLDRLTAKEFISDIKTEINSLSERYKRFNYEQQGEVSQFIRKRFDLERA